MVVFVRNLYAGEYTGTLVLVAVVVVVLFVFVVVVVVVVSGDNEMTAGLVCRSVTGSDAVRISLP